MQNGGGSPKKMAIGEGPTEEVCRRSFVGEGPREKCREGLLEKGRRRRSDEEGSREKNRQRGWLPEKSVHSRTNHDFDIM